MIFPKNWLKLIHDVVPSYVKERYSIDGRWKNKPFEERDLKFFSKGVVELSDLFTYDRGKNLKNYFKNPKYRSSYLLYFFTLQGAKVLTLLKRHEAKLKTLLDSHPKDTPLKVLDLGSGPGTAGFAVLFWLEELLNKKILPVELTLVDQDKNALDESRLLVEKTKQTFPFLGTKLKLTTICCDLKDFKARENYDFVVLANTLNEQSDSKKALPLFSEMLKMKPKLGVLCLEPATEKMGHLLSEVRDRLVVENSSGDPVGIIGPCLHSEGCPLSHGKDWCHFSFPLKLEDRWFLGFSRQLGSERQWLKLSYLWLSSGKTSKAQASLPNERLVISDPLKTKPESVLICEPEKAGRYLLKFGKKHLRGDVIKI